MTLTTALVLTAVAVLAAIALQGWWSARRAAPRKAEGTVPPQPVRERVEPTLGPLPAVVATASTARRVGGVRIDALIDAIATLGLEAPVSGDTVLAHLPTSRRAGAKPMLFEGLNADNGDWEPPVAGARYSELQAAVQLANRSGALNEIEFSEFVQKMQDFADAVGAVPDVPDMLDVVARARELDAFASAHDANLTVHLQANSVAWSVGFLRQCAERRGFVAGHGAARLVLPGAEEGAPPVLTLAYDTQAALSEDPQLAPVRRATLTLDVAQTPAAAEPFVAWQQAIRTLAEDLDASAVDDEDRPITLAHYKTIATELDTLYQALEARDMAAGSAVARRLFQ